MADALTVTQLKDWQVASECIADRLAKKFPNCKFEIVHTSSFGKHYLYIYLLFGTPDDEDVIRQDVKECCYSASHHLSGAYVGRGWG